MFGIKENKLRNRIDEIDRNILLNIELKNICEEELSDLVINKNDFSEFEYQEIKQKLIYDIERYSYYIEVLKDEIKSCLKELSKF